VVGHLDPMRTTAACPVCATPSRRVHRRYQRRPWDLPWGQWPVPLVVQARRFFGDAPTCLRRIVVDPFPQVLARSARQTARLRQRRLELAHAGGAEMGARLARWLGSIASPDPLLRQQRQASFVFPAPRVLGVDEFARRRGWTDGTLRVDLERRQPIAVLEGRPAEPLITWLQAHPAIAVLVRDRADAYALAGRVAAPDALQVADRCPRARHVSEALTTLLHSRRWHQPGTGLPPEPLPQPSVAPTGSPADAPPQASQPPPGSARSGRPCRGTGMSGGPSGRSPTPWGWIAGRCARIGRRTSHRSIRPAGPGRPS
jgi:transposase